MAKIGKRPTDDQLLEGGGAGAGMGRSNNTTLMPRLNKPEIEGYTYRSPSQTNARSLLPHPRENVVESQRADIDRIGRGLNASGKTERGRLAQQEAAGRAITRTTGRAAGVGAAGIAGAEIGERMRDNDSEDKKDDETPSRAGMGEIMSGKGMKKGGSVSSASKRADGCATKGKTKGRFV